MKANRLILTGMTIHAETSEDFTFPNTAKLYEYWKLKRGERPRPRSRDINLMDIHDIAPCLCVRDVIPGEDDFLCRYWGTRLTDLYGVDCTGKRIAEAYSPSGARNTLEIYRKTLASDRPVRLVGDLGYVEKSELNFFEGVFLRLDGDDQPDSHVIGAFQFKCELCAADMAKLDLG